MLTHTNLFTDAVTLIIMQKARSSLLYFFYLNKM